MVNIILKQPTNNITKANEIKIITAITVILLVIIQTVYTKNNNDDNKLTIITMTATIQ